MHNVQRQDPCSDMQHSQHRNNQFATIASFDVSQHVDCDLDIRRKHKLCEPHEEFKPSHHKKPHSVHIRICKTMSWLRTHNHNQWSAG